MGQVRNEVKGRPLDADHAKELGYTPGKVLQYNATVQWIAPFYSRETEALRRGK